MKINWKVRMKSGAFWLGIASAVITAVFAVLDVCGVVTNVTASELMRLVTLLLMVPASIGVISDPTTKGLADSTQAMGYEEPHSEDK